MRLDQTTLKLEEALGFLEAKIIESEDVKDVRMYSEIMDCLRERAGHSVKGLPGPGPWEPMDIDELPYYVGRPVYVDDGTFRYWRVLKEIHIHSGPTYILNFTDSDGGWEPGKLKIYPGEKNKKTET